MGVDQLGVNLPPRISLAGYCVTSGTHPVGGGALHCVHVLKSESGSLACLRVGRSSASRGNHKMVDAYIRQLYTTMRLFELGGSLRWRTIEEQVEVFETCRLNGVRVPRVLMADREWILTEYVQGRLLKDYLQDSDSTPIIQYYLNTVAKAHRAGIVLGDRWGGNEIVESCNEVCLVDFDIEVLFPERWLAAAYSFDLSLAIRACLLWSTSRADSLRRVIDWLKQYRDQVCQIYDMRLLTRFLAGSITFYSAQDRPIVPQLSTSKASQVATNATVRRLNCEIRRLFPNG